MSGPFNTGDALHYRRCPTIQNIPFNKGHALQSRTYPAIQGIPYNRGHAYNAGHVEYSMAIIRLSESSHGNGTKKLVEKKQKYTDYTK